MPRPDLLRQLQGEWRTALAGLPAAEFARPAWMAAVRPRMAWHPAALYAQLEEVRREFGSLRAPIRRYAGRYVNPGWTHKDLLTHLLSWAVEFRRQVDTLLRGEEFDYEIPFQMVAGPAEWNQAEIEKRREMTMDEIFEAFDAEVRGLQDMVIAIPLEKLLADATLPIVPAGAPGSRMRNTIAGVIAMKCMHDLYHVAQIRRWLRAQP